MRYLAMNMPSCENCGADLGESFRFCPGCATPQTDEARRRLNQYINQRAQTQSSGATGESDLRKRVQHAVGYVAVVAGLTTLLSGPGVFFLLAGLLVLPPVQRTIEARLGRRLGTRPTAAGAAALIAVGAIAFVIV